MTQTSNIGLKKIDGSENWRNVFDYHNDSMDLADKAIAGVQAGLTYVENGDTIAANANYTAGKFIAWKGEIYRVKATINATVTSANWTTYLDKQDGIGGALSQINGDLTALNSKLMIASGTCTSSYGTVSYRRYGQIVMLYFSVSNLPSSAWVDISTDIPHAVSSVYAIAPTQSSRDDVSVYVIDNRLRFYGRGSQTDMTGTIMYLTDS